ncbi:predicted protein [Histoplasma mississippiense (nom. inval.)]|uniref:predicted protein n=1 Tax=Ajellomyces capsulatus (strain NAm1 / WU24) TaxID=2059318 RepID=UPI000157C417|nr:predicted protein [Histoplasma mississippiense (nom. inval.)]EDN07532.1 predicted protein [Histoplasma mississippiense (nom. inval.)]
MMGCHTRYAIFGPHVRARNNDMSARVQCMWDHSFSSSSGGNVAVSSTICVLTAISLPSCCIWGRKLTWSLSTVWHNRATLMIRDNIGG